MKKYFSNQKLNDFIYEWIENPHCQLQICFAFLKSCYKGLTTPSKTWINIIVLVVLYLLFKIFYLASLFMNHFFTALHQIL